jgi:uncharacterized membrane-anchored protein
MNNRALLKFLICALIPLLILGSMSITPLLTLMYGQEIAIKTKPVDPRDVFRGDHVILSYEINEIAIDKVPPVFKDETQWQKLYRKPLYVILKKEGEFHVVDRAVFEKPSEGIYLKAYVQSQSWPQGAVFQGQQNVIGIQVSYNLDQFFVPENTGTSLEFLSRRGQLTAFVKVWNGYSTLVDVRP